MHVNHYYRLNTNTNCTCDSLTYCGYDAFATYDYDGDLVYKVIPPSGISNSSYYRKASDASVEAVNPIRIGQMPCYGNIEIHNLGKASGECNCSTNCPTYLKGIMECSNGQYGANLYNDSNIRKTHDASLYFDVIPAESPPYTSGQTITPELWSICSITNTIYNDKNVYWAKHIAAYSGDYYWYQTTDGAWRIAPYNGHTDDHLDGRRIEISFDNTNLQTKEWYTQQDLDDNNYTYQCDVSNATIDFNATTRFHNYPDSSQYALSLGNNTYKVKETYTPILASIYQVYNIDSSGIDIHTCNYCNDLNTQYMLHAQSSDATKYGEIFRVPVYTSDNMEAVVSPVCPWCKSTKVNDIFCELRTTYLTTNYYEYGLYLYVNQSYNITPYENYDTLAIFGDIIGRSSYASGNLLFDGKTFNLPLIWQSGIFDGGIAQSGNDPTIQCDFTSSYATIEFPNSMTNSTSDTYCDVCANPENDKTITIESLSGWTSSNNIEYVCGTFNPVTLYTCEYPKPQSTGMILTSYIVTDSDIHEYCAFSYADSNDLYFTNDAIRFVDANFTLDTSSNDCKVVLELTIRYMNKITYSTCDAILPSLEWLDTITFRGSKSQSDCIDCLGTWTLDFIQQDFEQCSYVDSNGVVQNIDIKPYWIWDGSNIEVIVENA